MRNSLIWLVLILLPYPALSKTIRYELNVARHEVNLSGKRTVDFALMVNGSIPAPTLEFTEGDEAEIVVHNRLNEEVSIHWHGILLPPEMDGVAYVNTPPIHAGQSFTFRFPIRQHGTYWYHSHTAVQEQKGVYGAIVIHPKKKTIEYDQDIVAVLSDWSDENADDIIRNLRKDGEYYAYKKQTLRSWSGAIRAGRLGTFLRNEWTRMGGMDLSDVGYDAFLINGKKSSSIANAKRGQKLRIRVINAAASTYFFVALGNSPMKIISADGVDIDPIMAQEALLGMAETLDILYEVPGDQSVELRATAQDVTGFASAWIGPGSKKVPAPDKPRPDLYESMSHDTHTAHTTHDHSSQIHQDEQNSHNHHGGDHPGGDHPGGDHLGHDRHQTHKAAVSRQTRTLTVDEIRAKTPTAYSKTAPRYDLKLVLGGDMERYVWHINGKAIHEDRNLIINEGDVVRFTFENETMMHHPMHLHGHFFRVLNQFGDLSPLKHTVDVPPHGSRTIEFYANEPGEWMLHCHNLYHMKTGMARVVKYSTFTPKPEIAAHQKHDPHLHDHIYFSGDLKAATNMGEAQFRLSRTWDDLDARLEARKDEEWEPEADLFYRRWFGNYVNIVGGGTHFHEQTRAAVGVGYLLPMLIESQVLVDHKGHFRLDLEKEFRWTTQLSTDAEVKFRQFENTEWSLSLMYSNSWTWSAGLILTGESLGAGLQYKF